MSAIAVEHGVSESLFGRPETPRVEADRDKTLEGKNKVKNWNPAVFGVTAAAWGSVREMEPERNTQEKSFCLSQENSIHEGMQPNTVTQGQ